MSENGLKLLKGGILLWLSGWIYLAMLAWFLLCCVTLLCSVSIGSFTLPCGVICSTFFQDWLIFIMDEFYFDESFFVDVVYLFFNFLPSIAVTRPCLDITQK